tara:strand:+ start:968 stop:1288 length:321 start_codon:yes stop_codon:yes gene_type:complete
MALLDKKSLYDLVPGTTSGPLTPTDETLNQMSSLQGPSFDKGPESKIPGERDTLHEKSLEDIYQSQVSPLSSYGAGQPGGTWPSVNPSSFDLNGIIPSNYIDKLPK